MSDQDEESVLAARQQAYRSEDDSRRGARNAAVEGMNRRASADDFVSEAFRQRSARITEAPDKERDPMDPYYVDAANRATSERTVASEDTEFKAELEAFSQLSSTEYWNPTVEREVLEVAYKAIAAGESPTLQEAYDAWNRTKGPDAIALRQRGLLKNKPIGSRDAPKGGLDLEAERKRRLHLYAKAPRKGESSQTAFAKAFARLTRDRE